MTDCALIRYEYVALAQWYWHEKAALLGNKHVQMQLCLNNVQKKERPNINTSKCSSRTFMHKFWRTVTNSFHVFDLIYSHGRILKTEKKCLLRCKAAKRQRRNFVSTDRNIVDVIKGKAFLNGYITCFEESKIFRRKGMTLGCIRDVSVFVCPLKFFWWIFHSLC
jgi:hypothetical protein